MSPDVDPYQVNRVFPLQGPSDLTGCIAWLCYAMPCIAMHGNAMHGMAVPVGGQPPCVSRSRPALEPAGNDRAG